MSISHQPGVSPTVGIIGVGRLGRALVRRLPENITLLLADVSMERATEVAASMRGQAKTTREVFATSDIVLLVVPPEDIHTVVREHAHAVKPGAIIVNMATSVPTSSLEALIDRSKVQVIGAKLVGQAHAIACGRPGVLISSADDWHLLSVLRCLFGNIGPVLVGDEMLAGRVNKQATRAAVKLALDLQKCLENECVPAPVIEAAVKTVAAGTLEDYPPSDRNSYIEAIVAELHAAEALS